MKLTNGSKIAVIGGGPSGSFFSYFLLDLAKRSDTHIHLDIYEPQDYTIQGPQGCNHCGGIVSESLVQILASEGINIPTEVIQTGIDSYVMHTDVGSSKIDTPLDEKRIAAMYRGAGPLKSMGLTESSFDGFLLKLAIQNGATLINKGVTGIDIGPPKPIVKTKDGDSDAYDLVVGAVGLNPRSLKMFNELDFGFSPPQPAKTYITEFELGKDVVDTYFGNAMHVFLLNLPNLQFAAIIPKGNYVTLAMLGDKIDRDLVNSFLNAQVVKDCFPRDLELASINPCKCFPKINVIGAKQPFCDRVVLIGDCSISKLYKNGIGAAFITAKAAATTALLYGISKKDFTDHYWPACKKLDFDNAIGRFVFGVTHFIQKRKSIKRGLLRMVQKEQLKPGEKRYLSTVLWDTFTGSAPYRSILFRTLKPQFWSNLIWKSFLGLFPVKIKGYKADFNKQSRSLGKLYQHGEIIVRQGEEGATLFVIQSGKVEVVQTKDSKEVHLAILTEGDFFGEMAIFEKDVRSSTVRSIGQTRVLTIDKKTLMNRIQDDPSLTFRIIQKLSSRIRGIDHKISHIRSIDRRNWNTRPEQLDDRDKGN
ncbi:MAG: cyclic nucleotide-binding domain-containing protein [Candidatus Marinimicrobia bacterium]|nr:cyclic nucleotide-binding domain-containing protein [Candidatus Neomarinimicrobiota bacterium]